MKTCKTPSCTLAQGHIGGCNMSAESGIAIVPMLGAEAGIGISIGGVAIDPVDGSIGASFGGVAVDFGGGNDNGGW